MKRFYKRKGGMKSSHRLAKELVQTARSHCRNRMTKTIPRDATTVITLPSSTPPRESSQGNGLLLIDAPNQSSATANPIPPKEDTNVSGTPTTRKIIFHTGRCLKPLRMPMVCLLI